MTFRNLNYFTDPFSLEPDSMAEWGKEREEKGKKETNKRKRKEERR